MVDKVGRNGPWTIATNSAPIWASHRIDSEWASLKSVLLHRPGEELLVAQE